jgi:L-cysteine S-thiosulfotransferase
VKSYLTAVLSFAFGAYGLASAAQAEGASPEVVEKYINGMFANATPEWKARVPQDETQRACSQTRNQPSAAEADKIVAREKATIIVPADGNVLGNWKAGEAIAQSGLGGQFSDDERSVRGGNCYACHQLAPSELSYGTLGPSLTGYGKLHDYKKEDAKAAFAKIFNAQSVAACSLMPRFGYHKFLSEQQIKDVTAYLFDQQSPVNK